MHTIDLDRRKAAPTNLLLEATCPFDYSNDHLLSIFTEGDGVTIAFVNESTSIISRSIWIGAEDCRKLGEGLLKVVAEGFTDGIHIGKPESQRRRHKKPPPDESKRRQVR